MSFGGEGSNLYGEPLLENVREAWNEWRKANEVAARYDRKIAGAYLLLHYPSFGQGIDQNGAKWTTSISPNGFSTSWRPPRA